jgi:hypothetical protein
MNTLNNRIGIVISPNLYYKIVTFRLVTGKSAGYLAPCLPAVGRGGELHSWKRIVDG